MSSSTRDLIHAQTRIGSIKQKADIRRIECGCILKPIDGLLEFSHLAQNISNANARLPAGTLSVKLLEQPQTLAELTSLPQRCSKEIRCIGVEFAATNVINLEHKSGEGFQ
jgi:hypothetical protein